VSRTDARSNKLRRRPARTTPASIVSVVALAVGVGLVWITVLRLLNGRWPTDRRPGSHSVGHSAASSRTPRRLRTKRCSRRCVRL
jgi:hypothetical protein